jgi:hypothetical protein
MSEERITLDGERVDEFPETLLAAEANQLDNGSMYRVAALRALAETEMTFNYRVVVAGIYAQLAIAAQLESLPASFWQEFCSGDMGGDGLPVIIERVNDSFSMER